MKKLIYAVALTLTIASLSSAAYGTNTTKTSRFPNIVGAVQFPPNKAKVVRDSFHLKIPQDSRALSQMTITVPKGLTVRNDINLSDQFGQKITANICDACGGCSHRIPKYPISVLGFSTSQNRIAPVSTLIIKAL